MKKAIYETTNGGGFSKYDVKFNKMEMNDTQIDLHACNKDVQWTKPGEKLASLIDNGNGITVSLGRKKITLDYAQVEYVRLLLHAGDEANSVKHPTAYPTILNKFKDYK